MTRIQSSSNCTSIIDMIPVKLNKKPDVSPIAAEEFIKKNWSLVEPIKLKELVSYDSRTYIVESNSKNPNRYIFKIANSIESREVRYFECVSHILRHLRRNGISAQELILSNSGKFILDFYENEDPDRDVLKSFLLSYIEGELILSQKVTIQLCQLIGGELSKLTTCVDQIGPDLMYLIEFSQDSIWNVKNSSRIRHFIDYFECDQKKKLLTSAVDNFDKNVLPSLDKLTRGFIHGDPNDMNILIDNNKVVSFIDWQDSTISFKVYDLAILIFSLISISMSSQEHIDAYSIGKYCLVGYLQNDKNSLNELDISVLPIIVQTRVALSLCVGYYTNKYLDPSNEYLLHTQEMGWKILEDLLTNQEQYLKLWTSGN